MRPASRARLAQNDKAKQKKRTAKNEKQKAKTKQKLKRITRNLLHFNVLRIKYNTCLVFKSDKQDVLNKMTCLVFKISVG